MITHKPRETAPALWLEIIVFLSSYYPLFFILLIRDIDNQDIEKLTVGVQFGLNSWGVKVSLLAIIIFLLSSLATLYISWKMRKLLTYQEGGVEIKVYEAEQVRGDILNYTLPFLIGLLALDYTSYQSSFSLLVFLAFIFSFVRKEQISLLNPMFLLMGIRLYNIKYKEYGSEPEYNASVLCLGKVERSNEIIELKESIGIHFVFPHLKSKS